jgi:phosphoserine phosphatase
MTSSSRSALATTNVERLRETLRPWLDAEPGAALLFDADGTLWSDDVGHIAFEYACRHDLLRDAAREGLRREALGAGLSPNDRASAAELGLALLDAYFEHRYDEKAAAEAMVWCYAGFDEVELRRLVRDAFAEARHDDFLHHNVLELAAWARERGAETYVVSASPLLVIEEATASLGFRRSHLAGGRAATRAGLFEPRLEGELPYGPTKVTAGRSLSGDRPWLAAFGDSGFDLDLLAGARQAVGIGKKSALIDGLGRLPAAVLLSEP